MDPRTETVARGYDEIADRFVEWATEIEDDPRSRFRQALLDRVPAGTRVLELGCGAGTSDTQLLASTSRQSSFGGRARMCPKLSSFRRT